MDRCVKLSDVLDLVTNAWGEGYGYLEPHQKIRQLPTVDVQQVDSRMGNSNIETLETDERGLTERDKYITTIKEKNELRDRLEQLAEEAAELSQAALKLIRARGLSANITPVSAEKAQMALEEEVIDVLIAFDACFGYDHNSMLDAMTSSSKWLLGRSGLSIAMRCLAVLHGRTRHLACKKCAELSKKIDMYEIAVKKAIEALESRR